MGVFIKDSEIINKNYTVIENKVGNNDVIIIDNIVNYL